ncbi:hypothetical protein DFH07DRAFT_948615 [Mycena maculata]|uniref:Uncharacterized protein n=1 Tax=Mycena maculata TaxID=230809 RepID=A0AAD7KDX4_9AGAR|nr:hypothetical protein DFH07DRAFT_948611 [Mycena maculata]KAJ7783597.1 hypothetical protein DFH07DRAFT_948615 [Mycena maculata]
MLSRSAAPIVVPDSPVIPDPSAPFVYDWEAPHADTPPVPPLSFNGYPGPNPLPLHRLKFNPLGLYELRRHLGLPLEWNSYRTRFLASDLAWFASGASEDNQHWPNGQGFFPEFHGLRNSVPTNPAGYTARKEFSEKIRKVIFDLLTIWNRTWGSTTMLLHVEGTTAPNTPAAPEYLHASVYLPPAFIGGHPESHHAIAQIAQSFIESIGVPTVRQWTANAAHANWHLNQTDDAPAPNEVSDNTLVPAPVHRHAAHYIFRGRHAGWRSPVAAAVDGGGADNTPAPSSQDSDQSRYGSEPPEFTADALALLSALERIAQLEQEADQTVSQLHMLMEEATDLQTRNHSAADEQRRLHMVIASLQEQLTAASAALSSRSPPSYTSHLTSPVRVSRASPMLSTPGRSQTDQPLHMTTAYLDSVVATSHMASVRLMVRYVPLTRWSKELRKLALGEVLQEGILNALMDDLEL